MPNGNSLQLASKNENKKGKKFKQHPQIVCPWILFKLKWIHCPNRICFQARTEKWITLRQIQKSRSWNTSDYCEKNIHLKIVYRWISSKRDVFGEKSDWFGGFFAQRWTYKKFRKRQLRLQCSQAISNFRGELSHTTTRYCRAWPGPAPPRILAPETGLPRSTWHMENDIPPSLPALWWASGG